MVGIRRSAGYVENPLIGDHIPTICDAAVRYKIAMQ
jgi:hypothetical protein